MSKVISFYIFLFFVFFGFHSHLFSKQLNLIYCKGNNKELNKNFLYELKQLFNVDIFVESGTYAGYSTENAAGFFKEVHSIELSSEIFQGTFNRLKRYSNIKLYCGDSAKILPTIIPILSGKILFWLDGHFCGFGTGKGDNNTPILFELQAIKKSGLKDSIILIDDMRLFGPFPETDIDQSIMGYTSIMDQSIEGYPTLSEICGIVKSINENYKLVVIGDIGLFYPDDKSIEVSNLLESCTASRLFDESKNDIVNMDIVNIEKIIGNANEQEKNILRSLCEQYCDFERYGLGLHYRLWWGLVALHDGYYELALDQFKKVIWYGLKHPRCYLYLAKAAMKAGKNDEVKQATEYLVKTVPYFDINWYIRE